MEVLPHLLLLVIILFASVAGLIAWWKMDDGLNKRTLPLTVGGFLFLTVMSSSFTADLQQSQPLQTDPFLTMQYNWGVVEFFAPGEMQLRTQGEVKVAVSLSKPADQLEKKLEMYDLVIANAGEVKLAGRTKVHLTGASFTIIPIPPEVQPLLPDQTATWVWQIEPNVVEVQTLYFSFVALLEDVDGNELSIPITRRSTKNITIDASIIDQIKHFVMSKLEWLWAVIVGPVLLAVWRHLKLRPKSKEKRARKIWLPT